MDATSPVAVGTFQIVFDGGALGNPGKGYGSYRVFSSLGELAHERLDFGNNMTNNQAEYLTLIGALSWLSDVLGDRAANSNVVVRGDSLLVVNQVMGKWKVKNEGLRPLHRQAVSLLGAFGKIDVAWHRRDESVKYLGH